MEKELTHRFKSEKEREVVHTKALLKRAFLVQKRQKKTNTCQIIFPLLIILMLFLIQVLIDSYISDRIDNVRDVKHPAVIPPFLSIHTNVDDSCEFGEQFSPSDKARLMVAGNVPDSVLGSYGDSYVAGGVLNELSRLNFTGDLNFNPANIADFDPNNMGFSSLNYTRYDSRRASKLLLPIRPIGPVSDGYVDLCRKSSEISPLSASTFASKEILTEHLIDVFRENEKNHYSAAVFFDSIDKTKLDFKFTVATNFSRTLFADVGTVINLVSSALYRYTHGAANVDEIVYHGYRSPPSLPVDFTFDLISIIGPYMYIFVLSLMSPIIMSVIVYDKEMGLRDIMKQMGLKSNVYWFQQYLFGFLMYFISVMIMWALAAILGFAYWLNNDFFVIFLTLFFWGHVIVAFSFFLSVFFNSSRSATVVGYIFVFAAGILTTNLISNFYDNDETPEGIIFLISLVPHFNLFRALNILSVSVTLGGDGLRFADVADSDVRMLETWGFMWGQWIVLMFFAWYLENVLVQHRSWLFLFKKQKRSEGLNGKSEEKLYADACGDPISPPDNLDPPAVPQVDKDAEILMDPSLTSDSLAERHRVLSKPENFIVHIVDLYKTYPGLDGAPPKKAVNNLSLGIPENICMGFLGPNGAGKTTTISMLGGLFLPTEGSARLANLSVHNHKDMELLHQDMGVCPQHDHLWGDLTGREHLLFYGRLKGLKGKELNRAVVTGLEEVNLADAGSKTAKEYSGGMRRRLSVACALIGDPKIVLMDEPSTGLDPYSRRKLWDVILDRKKKCTILLTTHSMEECEKLCDRVAIMSEGQLKAVGTVADLKKRFGKGFKVSIISPSDPAAVARADGFIKEIIPKAVLLNTLAGVSHYEVSSEDMQLDYVFEQFLTRKSDYDITDFGVCNTTLEEVFFHVCFGDGIIPDQNAL
eukprot:GCRY01000498.1.p1 GENE.GCRY01000498.1~~GCRY01000498.1.p1  ORF type:complete len:926 (+),score=268.84 GCRY01000498.1:207-2984(+)